MAEDKTVKQRGSSSAQKHQTRGSYTAQKHQTGAVIRHKSIRQEAVIWHRSIRLLDDIAALGWQIHWKQHYVSNNSLVLLMQLHSLAQAVWSLGMCDTGNAMLKCKIDRSKSRVMCVFYVPLFPDAASAEESLWFYEWWEEQTDHRIPTGKSAVLCRGRKSCRLSPSLEHWWLQVANHWSSFSQSGWQKAWTVAQNRQQCTFINDER